MENDRRIAKVVKRRGLHDRANDEAYWLAQTPQARIDALEQIRNEYHNWRYGAEPRLQRVYSVVKRQ